MDSLARIAYRAWNTAWFGFTSRYPIGENVYDRDWDVLVILDTCRVDALRLVASDFHWLPKDDIESIWSVGSNSRGWISSTFSKKQRKIQETAYITANGYSTEILEHDSSLPSEDGLFDIAKWDTVTADDFAYYHSVRESLPKVKIPGYVPTEVIHDRAISTYREYNPEKLIVHYHQPHAPYGSKAIEEGREAYEWERNPFKALQSGGVNYGDVWNTYLQELREALLSVNILRQTFEKGLTLAISADHGEAFGEWGLYEHILGIPHPKMKKVPWVTISTTGEKSDYSTEYPISESKRYMRDSNEDYLEEQLRQLGYQ